MSGRRAKALRREAKAIDPVNWRDLYHVLKRERYSRR